MDSKIANSIYKEINKLSLYFKNNICKYLEQNTNFVYSKKTSINDGLLFHLLKTQINSTQLSVSTSISLNNKNKISRQGLVKRSEDISVDNLNNIYTKLINKFSVSSNDNLNHIDGTKINIYNKNNKKGYDTINLLGVVNNKNNPINLYKNNDNNKSEIALFYEYIDNNLYNIDKTIVLDRLYFSDKLIDKCYEKNINFICRLKSNTKYLNKYKLLNKINKKITKNYNDYIEKVNNDKEIRIITFVKNKKTYHIASNLLDAKYDINYFINCYKKRWDVEIFFKITKANTNLDKIKTINKEKINKEIISINLVSFLYNYILNIYNKYTKNNKKINNSLFIKNFYEQLLYKIIKGKLNLNLLSKILNIIIVFYYDSNKNNINPRYSIMPYTKWHYKYIFQKI